MCLTAAIRPLFSNRVLLNTAETVPRVALRVVRILCVLVVSVVTS